METIRNLVDTLVNLLVRLVTYFVNIFTNNPIYTGIFLILYFIVGRSEVSIGKSGVKGSVKWN